MSYPSPRRRLGQSEAGVLTSDSFSAISHSSAAVPDSHRTCSPFKPKLTPGTSAVAIELCRHYTIYPKSMQYFLPKLLQIC